MSLNFNCAPQTTKLQTSLRVFGNNLYPVDNDEA